jgi:hypothetical protein
MKQKMIVVSIVALLVTMLAMIELFAPQLECVKRTPTYYAEFVVDRHDGRGPHKEAYAQPNDECLQDRAIPNSSPWAQWRHR